LQQQFNSDSSQTEIAELMGDLKLLCYQEKPAAIAAGFIVLMTGDAYLNRVQVTQCLKYLRTAEHRPARLKAWRFSKAIYRRDTSWKARNTVARFFDMRKKWEQTNF